MQIRVIFLSCNHQYYYTKTLNAPVCIFESVRIMLLDIVKRRRRFKVKEMNMKRVMFSFEALAVNANSYENKTFIVKSSNLWNATHFP